MGIKHGLKIIFGKIVKLELFWALVTNTEILCYFWNLFQRFGTISAPIDEFLDASFDLAVS